MTQKMADLLDELVSMTNAASRAEVMRRAISIYALLLEEQRSGKRVEISDSRGRNRERIILAEASV